MDQNRISQLQSVFNEISHFITSDDDREQAGVWFARELMVALGYARWENFQVAIGRAVDSCKIQNITVNDLFHEVTKIVEIGKTSKNLNVVWLPKKNKLKRQVPNCPKATTNNKAIFFEIKLTE